MVVSHPTFKTFEKDVLKSKNVVIVDFFAEWCGPCKMMSPVFEEASEELDDVKFCKVDVDAEPNIAQEYAVMSIPTLIIFKDGKEVDRKLGFQRKDALKEWIDEHNKVSYPRR